MDRIVFENLDQKTLNITSFNINQHFAGGVTNDVENISKELSFYPKEVYIEPYRSKPYLFQRKLYFRHKVKLKNNAIFLLLYVS